MNCKTVEERITSRLRDLNSERNFIEIQMATEAASFAAYVKNRALSPVDLQMLLPADSAIVDYVEYDGKLAAFVVRKDGISRMEVGSVNSVAASVNRFHQIFLRIQPTTGNPDDSAFVLRKAVWEPVANHLNKAKLVIICPEGPLGRVPFAALPGADVSKYLIEEVALAVVPVPRLLPELLAERRNKTDAPSSMLAVGDVNFDALPTVKAAVANTVPTDPVRDRAAPPRHWNRLPETACEVTEIETVFRAARPNGIFTLLRGDAAKEIAVRAALQKYDYLYLATHGFFDDSSNNLVILVDLL